MAMTSAQTPRRPRPRGVSALEIIIAGSALGVALVTLLPVISRVGTVRSELADRATARQLLTNLLEHALAHRMDGSTGGLPTTREIESTTIPADQLSVLNHPQLDIRVQTTSDDPPLRRVTATLTWTSRTGEPARPVSLTAWIPPAEPQP